jgi:cation/acetate symporter
MSQAFSHSAFYQQLKRYYGAYTGGFVAFVILLAIAEQMGLPRKYIGYAFLFATIGLYAMIGFMSRRASRWPPAQGAARPRPGRT